MGAALPCLPALGCALCVAQMSAAPLLAPAMLLLLQKRSSFHPCKQGSRGFWAQMLLLGSEGLVMAQLLPPYLLGVPRAAPAGGAGKATGDGHGKDQSTCWERRNPGCFLFISQGRAANPTPLLSLSLPSSELINTFMFTGWVLQSIPTSSESLRRFPRMERGLQRGFLF